MAQEIRVRLFEPYYTFDTTDRAVYRMVATATTFIPSRVISAQPAQKPDAGDVADVLDL
jgi:hypothetical protein